jgi:hypothetical protein
MADWQVIGQLFILVLLISVCLGLMVFPGATIAVAETAIKNTWGKKGRIVVTIYLATILCVGFALVPGPTPGLHYTTTRYLPPNTRLSAALLSTPSARTLEDRNRLQRELARLTGRYVKLEVSKGGVVKPENTEAWPTLTDEELASVEIAAEPDWMLLNRGTQVEVWTDNKPSQKGVVLAIVPSDQCDGPGCLDGFRGRIS